MERTFEQWALWADRERDEEPGHHGYAAPPLTSRTIMHSKGLISPADHLRMVRRALAQRQQRRRKMEGGPTL
jgi:hypothetical protein